MPGESTFQQAQTILSPLSGISHSVYLDRPGPITIIPRYTEGNLEVYTKVSVITDSRDDIVNQIIFNAEAHKTNPDGYDDIFDSEFFASKVSAYGLPHILFEQGIPSSVRIATFGGPLTRGGNGGFDIMLLYPDQGILINYTTQMHLVGAKVRGCPSNAHVELRLYSSGQSDAFWDFLKQTDWGVKMNYYKPLEEVTSMSLEEFYQTFQQPTDKCIETPLQLWPVPEQ